MTVRKLLAAVVLSAAMAGSASASAAAFDRCSIGGKYFVRSVARYSTTEDAGYTSYSRFLGAEAFVPAQPGLTQEWLQRVLTFQVAAGECDFGTTNLKVSVLSSGSGFSVRLEGPDEKTAKVILAHAEQLVK
jgi:hypothetical protein